MNPWTLLMLAGLWGAVECLCRAHQLRALEKWWVPMIAQAVEEVQADEEHWR